MKIRQQIILFLLIFSILPVGLFGAFTIYRNNQEIESMTRTYLESIGSSQISNIQNFCESRREELSVLSSYSLVQDALLRNLGSESARRTHDYLDNLLKESRKTNPAISSLSVLDRSFRVIGSSEPYTPDEVSAFQNKNAKYHTGAFRMGSIYERATSGGKKRLVPAYIGSFLNGELIGYIAAEIDTAYFDSLEPDDAFLRQNGNSFFIVDSQNSIVSIGSQDSADTLEELSQTRADLTKLLRAWNAVDQETHPQGELQYTYLNARYITYYAKVANTDWTALVTVNLTAQLKNAAAYQALIFFTVVLLAIGLLCAHNFVSNYLLTPLEHIVETLRQVKETQDYSLRTNVHLKNEVGFLAQGIDELLGFIQEEDLQEKAQQHHLEQLAQFDSLTGIKNKKAIEQEILNMVQEADETGEQIAIGFVDIDNFREYNSNFGHLVGDCTIQFVSQVLQETVQGSVGRNGGDEFVFCCLGKLDSITIAQEMDDMLHRMNEGFYHEEFGTRIPITCSIGIVTGTGSHLDYATLIQRADEAMYKAKNAGKNTFCIVNLEETEDSAIPNLPYLT